MLSMVQHWFGFERGTYSTISHSQLWGEGPSSARSQAESSKVPQWLGSLRSLPNAAHLMRLLASSRCVPGLGQDSTEHWACCSNTQFWTDLSQVNISSLPQRLQTQLHIFHNACYLSNWIFIKAQFFYHILIRTKQDEEFRWRLNCSHVINLHTQLFWAYKVCPELVIF